MADVPIINVQALIALAFFAAAVLVARAVVNIYGGKWPGSPWMLFYLRALLGFLVAGAIVLAYYSFAGKDIISGRM
ncbi:MAG: flagellar biosynthesis protein FliR [Synergistaceae bacterium]|jgi:hypothetical protein|nr:flagellar biosynthesis protein FliR [Synergistaceae bacterium]